MIGVPRFAARRGNAAISIPSSPHNYRHPRLPEVNLLAAVVEDALDCLYGSDRNHSSEANEWFASERRDWPFSFLNICDFLGMDALALRKRLGAAQRPLSGGCHGTKDVAHEH